MAAGDHPIQRPAGPSSFFFLAWLLPTFLALPVCLAVLFTRKGHRKPAFVISVGIAYILTGIAHILLLFDDGSLFRGLWADRGDPKWNFGQQRQHKDNLCTVQVSLTAGVGFLIGFHLIGLIRELLNQTKDTLRVQGHEEAQHLIPSKRRKVLTICWITFAWVVYGIVAAMGSFLPNNYEYGQWFNEAFGADGGLPYCSIPTLILAVSTEVPLVFASCIMLVLVIRNYLRIRVLPAARAVLSEGNFLCQLSFTVALTIILTLHAVSMSLKAETEDGHPTILNNLGAGPTLLLALSATAFASIYTFQLRMPVETTLVPIKV